MYPENMLHFHGSSLIHLNALINHLNLVSLQPSYKYLIITMLLYSKLVIYDKLYDNCMNAIVTSLQ